MIFKILKNEYQKITIIPYALIYLIIIAYDYPFLFKDLTKDLNLVKDLYSPNYLCILKLKY